MTNAPRRYFPTILLAASVASCLARVVHANTPVVVQNEAGFEGLEEPTVIYFPATNTFETDPTNFQNHVDEGGGMFRDTLRNDYPTLGWWDGDGADPGNTDRQRSEPKGIVGLGHQQVGQTFEYSFDFRTDPTFQGTSLFDHIFQLKATNGDDGSPLATISLYQNGQGRIDAFSDGDGTTGTTETHPATFTYVAGQWMHFVIRITPCAAGQSTGSILLSVNGGAFSGVTNAAIDLTGSTDFRPKFGFYRGISTTAGVPTGDSWVEHRTITGYIGTSNVLSWKGGLNNNTWDTATTANFLNGTTASTFNTIDQINFTATTNTTINIAGSVWPGFADVNSSANYTFQGTGSITGGVLRKDGTGTLTLATINSCPGLTDVTNGTLFVTGSIGNNSLASITGGTLKLGSATALGSNNTNGLQIAGGTLDLDSFAIGSIAVQVQGAGLSNAGAIVNNGGSQTTAMSNVTLTGDTTFGGTGRWDIRGAGASLSTGGSPFNLTKTGTNQISFVATTVDPALANITLSQGILAFQTSTSSMGDPTKTLTISPGATLDFYNTIAVMSKVTILNGGTLWAESGSGTQNTFAGDITVTSSGGTFDAGSALTGGTAHPTSVLTLSGPITASAGALTKNGPGIVTLSNPADTFSAMTVNAGTLNLAAPAKFSSLTLAGTLNNWSATVDIAALAVETTPATKSAILSTLQNQLLTNAITTTSLPTNTALALLDNSILKKNTFNGLAVDTNALLIAPEILGDVNADGSVDLSDLNLVLDNLGTTSSAWTSGNFDGAATIDLTDLNDVLNNLGTTNLAPALPTPEPASLTLLALASLLLTRRRSKMFNAQCTMHNG
jgi:autotransporter-associated beta strand protein